MGFSLQNPFSIFVFVSSIASLFSGHNLFVYGYHGFSSALGTWYGDPRGAGSTGGACGWGDAVQSPPLSGMIAAGNARIFLQGKGCGDCYQIKCNRHPYCSLKPIIVTITNECPGCNSVPFHFDLSGTAFGAMANPGEADNLRNLGQVDIQYRRVPCNYGRTKIAFKVDAGTTPSWFATTIEYNDGADGELSSVEIAPADGMGKFVRMNIIWGSVWAAAFNPEAHGPFSFRITSETGKVLIAWNAVPKVFVPGQTYKSNVNF